MFVHVRPNGDDGWLPDWLVDKVQFDQACCMLRVSCCALHLKNALFDQMLCLIELDKYLASVDDDFDCATPKP